MTKSLMITMQPKQVLDTIKGKRKLELRTWIPKDYVGWVYVYITKGKPKLIKEDHDTGVDYYIDKESTSFSNIGDYDLNGKVVFRFWFDEYDDIVYTTLNEYVGCNGNTLSDWQIGSFYLAKLQLTYNDILDYGKGKDLYAWHIKKLEVFNEPAPLNDFYVLYGGEESFYPLKNAPKSRVWVYVRNDIDIVYPLKSIDNKIKGGSI